jgi:tetratricopeptide (TPR) repeat protein
VSTGGRRVEAWIGPVLLAATLAVWFPVAFLGFVQFDDPTYVSDNPRVLAGLSASGVTWAFTTFHFANWHPLTWLSYMVDAQLFGGRPGPYHVTNLALHAATSLLVFTVFRRMTGAVWRPAALAALFAVHPLHVESVAWISERKDVLSGLFAMLTIWSHAAWSRRPSPLGLARTTALLALGLMAKPMLVTLPFVLLLLDRWPLARWEDAGLRRLVLEKAPLFALVAVSCALTVAAQRAGGTVGGFDAISPGLRLANAAVSTVSYLGMTLWPAHLAVFYAYPESIPPWQTAGAVLLLTALSAGALAQWRARPFLAVGWLWFLGMLVPVIGLVQVGRQALADRYMYLPILGLLLAAVWGAGEVAARGPGARRVVAAAGGAAVLACAAVTSALLPVWQSSVLLFERVLEIDGKSPMALNNLGSALVAEGHHEEALPLLEEAVAREPAYAAAWSNLGSAWFWLGRLDRAVEAYERAVAIDPDHVPARMGLAASRAAQGRPDLAREHALRAVELRPLDEAPKRLLRKIEDDLAARP